MTQTALDILRLYRSEGIGPVGYRQALAQFGDAGTALAALASRTRYGSTRVSIYSERDAMREIKAGQALGATLLCHTDLAYSSALWSCEDAPPLLWCLGRSELLTQDTFAIVGARNASVNGQTIASRIASHLSHTGLVIASGLARGTDGAAHKGALQGQGSTIAVLAGGIDHVYPTENKDLYYTIVDQGLIVSEMPPGTQAQARHFPRRNRIISGLSLGVLVVEAARRSGSLITARTASEQGRHVYAIPGQPMDQRAHGPNDLIRDGATLVQSADDILEDLAPLIRSERPVQGLSHAVFDYRPDVSALPRDEISQDDVRAHILSLLSPTPTVIDDLVRSSGSSPAIVQMVLLELELANQLTRHAGQKVSLTIREEKVS